MVAYPDDPSHQQDLPAFAKSQERLTRFGQLLYSSAGAGVDINAELDSLQVDLQALAGGGDPEP
jgi:hypothetical protein